MPQTVHVALGDRSYDLEISTGRLDLVPTWLASWVTRRGLPKESRSVLLVTDRNVERPHAVQVAEGLRAAGWLVRVSVLEPGEKTKSLEHAALLYDELVDMAADRNTVVIAVGGGVIGDLAGFVAATYARGLPFVQIPTTLLAQVDSSVGGKVGINHPRGKNLIGAFHQPLGVCLDTTLLSTLPDRDYRSGLAEVVKYGVILDAEFFAYLEAQVEAINRRDPAVVERIVARSCELKADVVRQDEYERTGLRACLNYGHTFCHAFEALCGYGVLLHGEAVSIGMLCASRLAERLKRISPDVTNRQFALLTALHLPTTLPTGVKLNPDEVLACMRLDKKAVAGQLRFVLPSRMGHVETVRGVPEADVLAVLP